jgi:sulfoxide reductase heme-binding subunit YedZ
MRDALNRTARRIPTWSLYTIKALLAVWLLWQAANGALGPDPVKALEHAFGEKGLQLLIASLCITPLRWVGINLLKFRRALGLLGAGFVALHFAIWITLDMGLRGAEILNDLFKRPYIVIGFVGFLLLIPLVVTSNNRAIKKLGPAAWNRLHWLTYPAIFAGAMHFVMIGKVYTLESGLYLAAVAGLLLARRLKVQKKLLRTA